MNRRPLETLLVAGLGFALGRLRGALWGLALLHAAQRSRGPHGLDRHGLARRARYERTLEPLVGLAARFARAPDGAPSPEARRALERYVARDAGVGPFVRRTVLGRIDALLRAPPSEQACCEALRPLPDRDRVHALFLLHRVAVAAGATDEATLARIDRTGARLGLPRNVRREVRALFAEPPDDPWSVLGLDRTAGAASIRSRYLELVRALHPDRHQHRGGEAARDAEARFLRIQRAYERIKDGRSSGALSLACPRCRRFSSLAAPRCPACGATKPPLVGGALRVTCPFCASRQVLEIGDPPRPTRCPHCRVFLVR